MGKDAPDTLPADFDFSQQENRGDSTPESLPADFFEKKKENGEADSSLSPSSPTNSPSASTSQKEERVENNIDYLSPEDRIKQDRYTKSRADLVERMKGRTLEIFNANAEFFNEPKNRDNFYSGLTKTFTPKEIDEIRGEDKPTPFEGMGFTPMPEGIRKNPITQEVQPQTLPELPAALAPAHRYGESVAGTFGAGLEKIAKTKEIAEKENLWNASLNAFVGTGQSLLGVAQGVSPSLAAFTVGINEVTNQVPSVEKALTPSQWGQWKERIKEKYKKEGKPAPSWIDNSGDVIDFAWNALIFAGAHKGIKEGKTRYAINDFNKGLDNLTTEQIDKIYSDKITPKHEYFQQADPTQQAGNLNYADWAKDLKTKVEQKKKEQSARDTKAYSKAIARKESPDHYNELDNLNTHTPLNELPVGVSVSFNGADGNIIKSETGEVVFKSADGKETILGGGGDASPISDKGLTLNEGTYSDKHGDYFVEKTGDNHTVYKVDSKGKLNPVYENDEANAERKNAIVKKALGKSPTMTQIDELNNKASSLENDIANAPNEETKATLANSLEQIQQGIAQLNEQAASEHAIIADEKSKIQKITETKDKLESGKNGLSPDGQAEIQATVDGLNADINDIKQHGVADEVKNKKEETKDETEIEKTDVPVSVGESASPPLGEAPRNSEEVGERIPESGEVADAQTKEEPSLSRSDERVQKEDKKVESSVSLSEKGSKGEKGKEEIKVEPIRQLGTGSNVYFESKQYRVNDSNDGVLLIARDGDVAHNFKFDTPEQAVKVAEILEKEYPEGIPPERVNQKYIDALKNEGNIHEQSRKANDGNAKADKTAQDFGFQDRHTLLGSLKKNFPKEWKKAELKADKEFEKGNRSKKEVHVQDFDKKTLEAAQKKKGQTKDIKGARSIPKSQRKIKNPRAKAALRIESQAPLDAALQWFISGGKIKSKVLDTLFGGGGNRKIGGEKSAKMSISNNREGAESINDIAHELWEARPEGSELTTQDYREAVEKVLGEHNNTKSMIDELLDRHGVEVKEHKAEKEIHEAAEGLPDNVKQEMAEHGVDIEDADIELTAEQQNVIDHVLDNHRNEDGTINYVSLQEEIELSDPSKQLPETKALLKIVEDEKVKQGSGEAASANDGGSIAEKEAEYNRAQADYERARKNLEGKGQANQLDIQGRAPAQELLFQDDLSEQSKQVAALKEKADKAKAELEKAQKQKEVADQKADLKKIGQQDLGFVPEEKIEGKTKTEKSAERLAKAQKALSDKLRGSMQSGGLNAIPEFVEYVKAFIEHSGNKIEEFVKKFREDFPESKVKDEELSKSFEDVSGGIKKTIATIRAYEGEVREGVKNEIERLGLTRDVESRVEAKQKAKDFIEAVGEDAALEAVRNNEVSDAAGAYVWNELIESVDKKIATEKDPVKIAELEQLQAQLFQEFSRKALSGGRFSSALADIYENSDLGYNLAKKIQDYKDQNGGVIPKEVEERFREIDKRLKEVNEKLAEAEKKLKEETKRADKAESLLKDKKIKEASRNLANAIRKGKLSRPDVFSQATPASIVWDGALEVVAKTVELTGDAAQAVADGLKYIKESDWYKNATEDTRAVAEKSFSDWFNGKNEKEQRVADNIKKQIDDLKRRIEEKDFSKKEKSNTISNSEIVKLKAEKLRLQNEYDKEFYKNELRNRTKSQKIKDTLWDLWSLTRVLRATGEFSFVGVQGLINTIAHPIHAAKAIGTALKLMTSEKRTERFINGIKSQEWYPEMKESKLSLTEPHAELTAREELFYSDWANMIWNVLGKPLQFIKNEKVYEGWKNASPFKAVERASVGFLDTMRVLRWLDGKQMLEKQGLKFSDNPQAYKDMADVINTFTGRASIGGAERFSKQLTRIFFSPRLWASQIKTATPYAFYHFGKMRAGAKEWRPSVAQKMAISDFSKFVGLTTGMVTLAYLHYQNDGDPNTGVETDPTSSDFGKIKIGDTRVDPWGGRIQDVIALSRIIADSIKKGDGRSYPLGMRGKTPTRTELLIEMATNKLAPSAAMLERYGSSHVNMTGQRTTKYGDPYSFSEEFKGNLYPIYWGTVHDLLKDDPTALDGLLTFYAFFGGGVNVYTDNKKQGGKKTEQQSNGTEDLTSEPLQPEDIK